MNWAFVCCHCLESETRTARQKLAGGGGALGITLYLSGLFCPTLFTRSPRSQRESDRFRAVLAGGEAPITTAANATNHLVKLI